MSRYKYVRGGEHLPGARHLPRQPDLRRDVQRNSDLQQQCNLLGCGLLSRRGHLPGDCDMWGHHLQRSANLSAYDDLWHRIHMPGQRYLLRFHNVSRDGNLCASGNVCRHSDLWRLYDLYVGA